ncbi:ATP-dependent helicase [Flavobacterium antarcticum]|uniref:ATP-dependent helicase n=1 Tax=Flavobacterium antarcticum TaxID=271155 RepID=UPI0003B6DBE3|nr:ATP-dependent helicase [Flavobacterium antarcticum]
MSKKFTPNENQKKVIAHFEGHARVLAIAGSGKTTTMVHRIKNLIETHKVNPKKIRVLMFNAAASKDFKSKCNKANLIGVDYISTFHAFSYKFIQSAITDGDIPASVFWTGENDFEIDKLLNSIIKDFERKEIIEKGKVELEDVSTAISLWKGSLISVENAGHHYSPESILVYKEFEKGRKEKNALTYDDFIPITVKLLSENQKYIQKWLGKIEHLIVDEYQDINYGQQRLIELLAGNTANIMVVGDDDQTIYEWRGARPEYILNEFQTKFTSKPHTIFKLDETFRFGPILAQCAQNTIIHNTNRKEKNVLANKLTSGTDIEVFHSSQNKIFNVNDELCKTVIKLVKEEKVIPKDIRVIARLYSQLSGLETSFLRRKIPYKIEGSSPFYSKREITILIDYLFVIEKLESKIDSSTISAFLNVLNTPNRKLSKVQFEFQLKNNKNKNLVEFLDEQANKLGANSETISELITLLIDGSCYLTEMRQKKEVKTDQLVRWVYLNSKLENHYLNYYGPGEKAVNKASNIEGFIMFTADLTFLPTELKKYIKSLDSTRGEKNEDNIIKMSTVHRTKGLEFDYVFIPDCFEGNMPYISNSDISIFDTSNPEGTPTLSAALENERRLFYVAMTRAMKKVYIGTSNDQQIISSRFLEEIILTKTRKVLQPLINNTIDTTAWLESVKSIAGKKNIINNVKRYLNILGKDELRMQVDVLELNTPEDEFAYRRAYPNKKMVITEAKLEDSTWGDVSVI